MEVDEEEQVVEEQVGEEVLEADSADVSSHSCHLIYSKAECQELHIVPEGTEVERTDATQLIENESTDGADRADVTP